MRKIIFVLLIVINATASFCQDYYVTNNNDTIRGNVVNYKEWSKNPSEILFKTGSTNSPVTLTPYICKSVVIGNSDRYLSFHGTRVINSDNISAKAGLHDHDQLQKDSVHIFLREIYRYKDIILCKLFDNKRINFYMGQKDSLTELEYYEYINDANIVVPYDNYKMYIRSQLLNENKKNLDQKIERLSYKEKDLINFFATFFGDNLNISENLRNKYPTEFFISAGLNMNAGKIENTAVSDASYNATSFSPALEIGLRIYSQRNFGRLFFQPAINISTSLSHSFRLKDNSEYKMKASLLSGRLSAGYFFQKNSSVAFYGMVGAGITLVLDYSTRFINGTYSNTDKAEKVINKLLIHPELGLIIYKRLNVAVTGGLPFKLPVFSNLTYKYTISQAGITIRYIFKKRNNQ